MHAYMLKNVVGLHRPCPATFDQTLGGATCVATALLYDTVSICAYIPIYTLYCIYRDIQDMAA